MKSLRAAVRQDLERLTAGDLVLVACSGGADSMGLAIGLLDVAPEFAIRVGVIAIDHDLQPGSRARAEEVVASLKARGADPAEAITVQVGKEGGLEAAAREARYEALTAAADRHGAAAIYLGHTSSDQAETVLLGLARGSGARSLSGMADVNVRYRRPLLHLSRDQVREEVMEAGVTIWDDPHNADPRFTRVRARAVMNQLERELGPGIEEALVRSAALLRDDADALDEWAAEAMVKVITENKIDLNALMVYPRAIRTRVIKQFFRNQGLPSLTADHIRAVDALASDWRGQGPVALPGHMDAAREGGLLTLRPRA